jgi:hypothetical protein
MVRHTFKNIDRFATLRFMDLLLRCRSAASVGCALVSIETSIAILLAGTLLARTAGIAFAWVVAGGELRTLAGAAGAGWLVVAFGIGGWMPLGSLLGGREGGQHFWYWLMRCAWFRGGLWGYEVLNSARVDLCRR